MLPLFMFPLPPLRHFLPSPPFIWLYSHGKKKNITAGAKNFDVEHFLPVLQDIPFQRILTRTSHPLALSNLLDKGSG